MRFSKFPLFRMLAAIGFGCILFVSLSFAETVTVAHKYKTGGGTVPATDNAPVAETYLEATPSNPGSVLNVVFYKNDVPIATVTSPFKVDLGELGQDTYKFRARANYPNDIMAESPDLKFSAYSRQIYYMGDSIWGVQTEGPKRWGNHTVKIQQAIDAISAHDGGTLFFPCTFGPVNSSQNSPKDGFSIYVINNTITIPKNVTLQGEAAGDKGPCQIWWHEPTHNTDPCGPQPTGMNNKPMFQVVGQSTHVRFKDLALRAMGGGVNCYYGRPLSDIAGEGSTGIEITTVNPGPLDDGHVSDVIIENVTISHFTRGISAVSAAAVHEIHNVKIRGALTVFNHHQLYVDAPYAYDWDVQNVDNSLGSGQGALEIIKAGTPPGYSGGRGDLRFVQFNCAGGPRREVPPESPTVPSKCITVNRHGGLYFKQVHVEGPSTTITVNDTVGYDNDAPIVFEASGLAGEFKDASMKLYTIGSFLAGAPESPQPSFWDSKMHFSGNGRLSKVVECGNLHGDRTDTDGIANNLPRWGDWTMQYTHGERLRASYYDTTYGFAFRKEPVTCPAARDDGIPDANNIGGAYFDSGVLPTEPTTGYTNQLTCAPNSVCDLTGVLGPIFSSMNDAGAVRISGAWELTNEEVVIPPYRLIVGVNAATITLKTANKSMFIRPIGVTPIVVNGQTVYQPIPASSMVMRDLTLKATTQTGTTAIRFTGTGPCTWVNNEPDMTDPDCHLAGATDFFFSGLTIEGFNTGFFGGRVDTLSPEPQIDSIALKNLKFVNNLTAVAVNSSNASNWNIMNLEMQSNTANAKGWYQQIGGFQAFQAVKCSGASGALMQDCLRFETSGVAVMDLRQGTNVTNMVTIESPLNFYGVMTGNLLIRDSDFRSSVANRSMFNINGKTFITSMNNRYQYFVAGTLNEWQKSRVTYCGDDFAGGPGFPGLDPVYNDLNFGIDMPTRLTCEKQNAAHWLEAFKWGGEYNLSNPALNDTPLVGNIYDENQEDYIIYRRTSASQFLIRTGGEPAPSPSPTRAITFGLPDDIPLTGRLLGDTRLSQIIAYRTGVWYVKDPRDPNPNAYWGISWGTTGDKPFTGNFFKEAGGPLDQRDEIAIYRPGAEQIWIMNPRPPYNYLAINLGGYRGNQVQTGDFLGIGNDQVAMFNNGAWYIVDADPLIPVATPTLGTTGDVAVAGKYLSQASGYLNCTQLGVWRPGDEEFIIADPSAACGGRGINPGIRVEWGSNGDYNGTTILDDVPLTINLHTQNGTWDRPAAYRQTPGYFPYSNQNGRWFVHDPF